MAQRILVTDVHTRKSFDVISIIKRRFKDIPLLLGVNKNNVVDKLHYKLLFQSNVELIRTYDENLFCEDLFLLSNKYKKDEIIFVPIEEITVLFFYVFLNKFGKCNFNFLLPNINVFNLLRDKFRLNEYCVCNNVNAPKFYDVKEIPLLGEESYPLLLKPCIGSGSKGLIRLFSKSDFTKEVEGKIKKEPYLVQELIENGKDVKGAFFLYKEGSFVSAYTHERIRTSPPEGGVTVYSKFSENQAIISIGKELLDKIGWSGLIMLEFLYDPKVDNYKIIEANPRIWGSIMLSEYSNVNLLTNYINICLKRDICLDIIKRNCYIRWFFPVDILNFLKERGRIKDFWRFDNTCFINWSFSNKLSSLYFNFVSIFSLKNIMRFFRK